MDTQFSGSNAEIWYKTEAENGLLRVDAVSGTAGDTTLTEAVNPGGSRIKVAAVTKFSPKDIIALGDENNQEIVKIKSVSTSTKTITLDEGTPVNFRHESGEAVLEVDPTNGWFRLGSVTSFTPTSDRPLEQSQAFGTGIRGISNARPGRYEFGGDITVELDLETAPLWLLHALNDNYTSIGAAVAPPVPMRIGHPASAGAKTFKLSDPQALAVGDFVQLGEKEVVKISAINSTNKAVTLEDSSNPQGLRYSHGSGSVVKKVQAPFTHTIVRGSTIPVGISLLLLLTEGEQESLILLSGNRINTLSLSAEGGTTIPTMTINTVAKRGQVLSANIFGAAREVSHVPYAQWEAEVDAGDSQNRFNSLTLEIQNNITAGAPLGSALPGAISLGEGSVTGSFEYEYRTQAFASATARGEETELDFLWTYIGDGNHSLGINLPKVRFGGSSHPAVTSKDPITDSKDFTALVDPASSTDIKIVAKTKNPSIEYLVE